MSNTLEHQVVARALALLRAGWVEGNWAVDAEGQSVAWYSNRATQFCAEGAIKRAVRDVLGQYRNDGQRLARTVLKGLCEGHEVSEQETGFDGFVQCYNDTNDKEAMIALFRKRLAQL